jgi:hypothetical protein
MEERRDLAVQRVVILAIADSVKRTAVLHSFKNLRICSNINLPSTREFVPIHLTREFASGSASRHFPFPFYTIKKRQQSIRAAI